MVTPETETVGHLYGTPWAYAVPVGIVVVLAVASVVYFKRQARYFAEEA
jgi:hypothetical protein